MISRLIIVNVALLIAETSAGDHQKRLCNRLLRNYDSLVRPVVNESDAIVVRLGIDLQQIIDVEWKDHYLSWQPEEFGGITEIRLPASRVWKPDILLYNSADEDFDTTFDTNINVYSDGSMIWIPPAMAILGFALPPDSGEKLSLGITIFMSLCVFLLMVAEAMPPTSDAVPLIGMYFSCTMVVVCASVFSTVVVLNFHHRKSETHDMSPYFRRLFLHWLPWVLMMTRPGHRLYRNPWRITTHGLEREGNDLPADAMRAYEMHPHIQLIYDELKFIVNRMKQKQRAKDIEDDWKFAAMVVDRLCLITFSGFLVCSTCAIIFSAPNMS